MLLWGWGVMNSTAIKEAAAVAYPREKMIGVWWSGAEPDVIPAGDQAKGYKALMLQHPAGEFEVHADLKKFALSTRARASARTTFAQVLYNRGLINSMLGVEAIRTAQKKFGNKPLTGEQVRWGFENLDLSAARSRSWASRACSRRSSCPAWTIRAPTRRASSSGTARRGRSSPTSTRLIESILDPLVAEYAAKYAAEKKITPRDCSKEMLSPRRAAPRINGRGGAAASFHFQICRSNRSTPRERRRNRRTG